MHPGDTTDTFRCHIFRLNVHGYKLASLHTCALFSGIMHTQRYPAHNCARGIVFKHQRHVQIQGETKCLARYLSLVSWLIWNTSCLTVTISYEVLIMIPKWQIIWGCCVAIDVFRQWSIVLKETMISNTLGVCRNAFLCTLVVPLIRSVATSSGLMCIN